MDVENWTIEKALQVGAEMELESYTLYTNTAETAKYPGAKKLLTEIAEDEKRHRDYFLKGLEDPANIQARTLQELGCDMIQGFAFAEPLPLGEYENYAYGPRAYENVL